MIVSFSETERVEMFDKIAKKFYYTNFGLASKTDIELMMFDFYIEKLIKDCQNEDGTIDYNRCSDYRISKDLGITQQRVRTLKVKKQLTNPIDFDWKSSFARLISNAKYDNHKVYVSIPDQNLFYEVQNFLEEQGAYIDKQLNSKLLAIRIEYFIDILLSLEPESNKEQIVKEIQKELKTQSKDNKKFDERNIGKTLIGAAADITTIIANISSLVSSGNFLIKPIINLLCQKDK